MSRIPLISLLVVALAACGGPASNPDDTDGDGALNAADNCPNDANADQADGDGDGVGDACDNCAARPNTDQRDTDSDGIGDVCDNCTATANPGQEDGDTDGRGNACDNCPSQSNANQADDDGDKVGDACDNCPEVPNANQADENSNGFGDVCEPGCAGAELVTLDDLIEGELPDPVESRRFYKFEGMADELIAIQTLAKPESDPFDPTFLDMVVTLYDESGETRLARNDDPSPRTTNDSFLLTRLPADGTYCVEFAECSAIFGTDFCADHTGIENFEFFAVIGTLDPEVVANESEPNNTEGEADALTFAKDDEGDYRLLLVAGDFGSGSDVDRFKFTVPSDLDIGDSRPLFNLDFFDGGVDGNGSTAGNVTVELSVDGSPAVVAAAPVDSDYGFGVPVTAGTTYVLTVKTTASSLGGNPFFLLQATVGSGNPLEQEPNDSAASAQELTAVATVPGAFFTEGNLAGTDVDWYTLPLPSNHNRISAVCAANTIGSGLTGVKIELFTQAEAAIANDTDIAGEPAFIDTATIPAGTSAILVKVSKTGQDTTNTGDFYRCGFRSARE